MNWCVNTLSPTGRGPSLSSLTLSLCHQEGLPKSEALGELVHGADHPLRRDRLLLRPAAGEDDAAPLTKHTELTPDTGSGSNTEAVIL